MSISKIEQSELAAGYATVESVHAIIGIGTVRSLVFKANAHPRMRLLVHSDEVSMATGDGFTAEYSFVLPLVDTGGNLVLDVVHATGVIAGRSGAQVTAFTPEPFGAQAAATDEPIFEADEDVYIVPSTANSDVADVAIAVLKFEVVA